MLDIDIKKKSRDGFLWAKIEIGGQSHQFSFTSEWLHCPRRLSLQLQRPVAGKSIRFPFFWRQVLDSFKNFLTTDRFQIIGTWFLALERGCKKTWFAFRRNYKKLFSFGQIHRTNASWFYGCTIWCYDPRQNFLPSL